jgi:hypothetical protein
VRAERLREQQQNAEEDDDLHDCQAGHGQNFRHDERVNR